MVLYASFVNCLFESNMTQFHCKLWPLLGEKSCCNVDSTAVQAERKRAALDDLGDSSISVEPVVDKHKTQYFVKEKIMFKTMLLRRLQSSPTS